MLKVYPLEEVLTAPYISNEWNPDLITCLLNELVPSKCRIILVSQHYEDKTPNVEPYYKTKYGTMKIEPETLRVFKFL